MELFGGGKPRRLRSQVDGATGATPLEESLFWENAKWSKILGGENGSYYELGHNIYNHN